MKNSSQWLLSQNKFEKEKSDSPDLDFLKSYQVSKKSAKTISITSGKGGVGKTSIAVKLSKMLAKEGKRVLLIDCDYNLSNTTVKLGIPITSNFWDLVTTKKSFDKCLYKDENFHLLSGCNGNLDLFEKAPPLDRIVMDIISEHETEYDFILLDCPAGIVRDALSLNAYCDYRFIVVTPDKSSITDSYSLMKILHRKFGIWENHLLVNKTSSTTQYKRIVKVLSETVENFLQGRLQIIGGISKEEVTVDQFDQVLFSEFDSKIHKDFSKVIQKFSEELAGIIKDPLVPQVNYAYVDDLGQDVPSTVS